MRHETSQGRPRICLAGAAPGTGNLGVGALCNSICGGLKRRLPEGELYVFDYGRGLRPGVVASGVPVTFMGVKPSKRVFRAESLWNIRARLWLKAGNSDITRAILRADAVVDISGGDSFSDLYGMRRFKSVAVPKMIVLKAGVPLILLPQTYGPFSTAKCRRIAERIVRTSAMAWARDKHSFQALRDLLGPEFDGTRHRCGVDVAFSLAGNDPCDCLSPQLYERLLDPETAVVGVNVSGLIWNDPERARDSFRLRADYQQVILELVSRLLRESDVHVFLVTHVIAPPGHFESDAGAAQDVVVELRERLGAVAAEHLHIVPPDFNASETKWIISHCDWFCGTRMHSTIAALSSGVPTAAIAYSDKTQGVFETCGQGRYVADPRLLDTEETVEHLWRSWNQREQARESLAKQLPSVLEQAERQMDEIVEFCARDGLESPSAKDVT